MSTPLKAIKLWILHSILASCPYEETDVISFFQKVSKFEFPNQTSPCVLPQKRGRESLEPLIIPCPLSAVFLLLRVGMQSVT